MKKCYRCNKPVKKFRTHWEYVLVSTFDKIKKFRVAECCYDCKELI